MENSKPIHESLINSDREALVSGRMQVLQQLEALESDQFLNKIREKLRQSLETSPREQSKRIRNLIKEIEHHISKSESFSSWEDNLCFMHADFLSALQAKGFKLSPAESKLAILIRLDLDSKKVAQILGISPESLRISRHRLRKKLKLKEGQKLRQFLFSV
ncbi:helix-turn-helix transcriptional regulator [Algoriphagus namhaensis]